jgi:FixJ family two-component response regulator
VKEGENQTPVILCVDDEPGILSALKRVFRSEPLRLITANNAEEALELLRQGNVHLVLTDYRMPGMTGVQVLEQACELCPDALRILLTGYADVGAVSDAINKGQIYKIIYKPWNENELKLSVRSALAHYARNEENAKLHKELEWQNENLKVMADRLKMKLTDKSSELQVCTGSLMTAQRVLDQLPYSVFGLDETGQIVFANQTAQKWFERTQCVLGGWADDLFPEPILACIAEVWEHGGVAGSVIEWRLPDGQLIHVSTKRIETRNAEDIATVAGVLVYGHMTTPTQYSSSVTPSVR